MSFVCVICQREVNDRWGSRGRTRILPPFCGFCEGHYSSGKKAPVSGAFMDRRNAVRIAALAEALLSEAMVMAWRHGDVGA